MISNVNSMNIQQNIFNTSATKIAGINSDAKQDVDLTKEVVGQMVAAGGFSANAPAIKTQDEMIRSLLDMKA